jgi:hypothetical protein
MGRHSLGWNRTEEEAQFRMEQNRKRGIVQDGTEEEERHSSGRNRREGET